MAKFKRTKRLKDITPHPIDEEAARGLSGMHVSCQVNPRGQIWHLWIAGPLLNEHIPKLAQFPKLTSLSAGSPFKSFSEFTDEGVQRLCAMTKLRALDLNNFSSLTNNSINHIASTPRIQWALLNCKGFDDHGIKVFAETNHLFSLGLRGSSVTCNSLPSLGQFTNLRRLYLSDREFDSTAVEKLKQELPRCTVVC